MLARPHLLEWQWSDYAAKHRDRANLLLHIIAVPLFQIASIVLVSAVLIGALAAATLAVAGMLAALLIQGRGHRREPERPAPFVSAADFASRFVAEQWITFPRFVLSGGWYRNWRTGSVTR